MPNNFQLQRSEKDGIVVFSLEGYLDAHTAPQFEKAIQTEFQAGRTRMIADCSKLTYISSAGLGVFMSFIEEIRDAGGDIKLAGIVPKVYQVFDVLGFPSLFEIVDNIDSAIGRFGQAQ